MRLPYSKRTQKEKEIKKNELYPERIPGGNRGKIAEVDPPARRNRARLDRALNRAQVWDYGIICGELDDDNADRFYTWFTDIVEAVQDEILNDLEAEYEAAYEDETLQMYIEDGFIAEWFPDVYITETGEAREDIAYTAIYA